MTKEERFSEPMKCGHCGNLAPMRVLGSAFNTIIRDSDGVPPYEAGMLYEVLLCPACDDITVIGGNWHDAMDDPSEWHSTVIYPKKEHQIAALPEQVRIEYEAAQKVASVSPNAHAVLLGRVLDCVCDDRGATGDTLAKRLDDLATRQEIPKRLAEMAHKLRQLRNVGAHANLGNLTKAEIPFLDALCRAVLEYVYGAPSLLKVVEERIKMINAEARKKRN